MPKPTPEDVLRGIEDSEVDDEVDRVLALTPQQRKEELEAAGFDMAALDAKADAIYAKVQRAEVEARAKQLEKEARAKSLRPQPRQRPVVLWIAAAATLAVAGGVVYAMLGRPPEAPRVPPPPPSTRPTELPRVDLVAASELRKRAFEACTAKKWEVCLAQFDEAKRVDVAGDRSPEVQLARQQAQHAIDDEGEKLK